MNVQVLNNLPKHLHCHMFRRTRAAGLYRNGVEREMISVISFEPPVIISFLDAGSIFYIYPDFISAVPFFGASGRSGIGTEVLFRVKVNHPSAAG